MKLILTFKFLSRTLDPWNILSVHDLLASVDLQLNKILTSLTGHLRSTKIMCTAHVSRHVK